MHFWQNGLKFLIEHETKCFRQHYIWCATLILETKVLFDIPNVEIFFKLEAITKNTSNVEMGYQ